MDRPVVVFADINIDGPMRESLTELYRRAEVVNPKTQNSKEIQAKKEVASAWITRTQPINRADLEHMPDLKLISSWGVGYNHIDLGAATERGIPVCINPVFSRSMAEAALTFIFSLSKRLSLLQRDAHTGRVTQQSERGVEIAGKTLGLVGFGRIGRQTGELARRLDMRIVVHDPYLPPDRTPDWVETGTLLRILQEADFIVLTAPLSDETHHMISMEQLRQMKSSAYLINIARGAIVDEGALYNALVEGVIAGAGIDVWENEPLSPDNLLLKLDNVIATPHKIGATWDGLAALCESIQKNVLLVLDGQLPLNVVNPEVLKR